MQTVADASRGIVIDASTLVSALVDSGRDGEWALSLISGTSFLAAPELCVVESLNILRRHELSGQLSPVQARMALASLQELPLETIAIHDLVERIWELRSNLTCYDASYVAVAEALSLPLATLNGPLRRAPGPICDYLAPPPALE